MSLLHCQHDANDAKTAFGQQLLHDHNNNNKSHGERLVG